MLRTGERRVKIGAQAWLRRSAIVMVGILLASLLPSTVGAYVSTRLQDRSLFMASAVPGATTSYKLQFRYITPQPTGSVELLFCENPIPYMPCKTPPGLDVSGASLTAQTGETGFHIAAKSKNRLVLSRPAASITSGQLSSYTFDGIKNPTDTATSFAVRLKTHQSTNATGSQVDFGSVRGRVTDVIQIETQVPPMLIFCLAEEVDLGCIGTNDVYYNDMGELASTKTLRTQSQMAIGTNASGGFAITVDGTTLATGSRVIDRLEKPTRSRVGTNQFGINLVANSSPRIGHNPEGVWNNALPTAGYSIPNHFKFAPGDIIAQSPSVSLMKKFTVSYIVNTAPNLHPGVYTSTINFIASGRF